MNGMRKLLFILMVLPFTLNVRAEDPPSMLEKAVSNIKRWEGWHRGKMPGKDSLLLSLLGFNVGCYRLIGNGKIPKSRLIQKLESGDRDIYREYISFRCYQGKVIPSIERRRKEEFELFYIP